MVSTLLPMVMAVCKGGGMTDIILFPARGGF
jgi:hypothetical protein